MSLPQTVLTCVFFASLTGARQGAGCSALETLLIISSVVASAGQALLITTLVVDYLWMYVYRLAILDSHGPQGHLLQVRYLYSFDGTRYCSVASFSV